MSVHADASVEANKALVRRVFDEVINEGRLEVIEEIYDPNIVDHDPLPGAPPGREGVAYSIGGLLDAFPDLHVTIEDMSAYGNFVTVHNVWLGTQTGRLLGLRPTGRSLSFTGVVIWRVEDGRIAERWAVIDLVQQLGVAGRRRRRDRPSALDYGSTVTPYVSLQPIPPEKFEEWEAFQEQLKGPRREEYVASRTRLGVRRETAWLIRWPQIGDLRFEVVYFEVDDLVRFGQGMAVSQDPFDVLVPRPRRRHARARLLCGGRARAVVRAHVRLVGDRLTVGASPSTGAQRADRKWWTLAAVTFSLFMIMLDNTVVTVALPAIQEGVGASLSQLEWVIDAYALAFAALVLTGGKLADFLGRRLIFVAGLAVFTLASLWCALSTTGDMLIAARAVQGVGAALMLPATTAIITDAFEPHERGLAFGIWAGVSGVGLAVGPLVGGLLVDLAHWSWIFYVNIPVGVVAIAASFLIVRESRDQTPDQRLDLLGLVTSAGAMFLVTFGLIESNRHGWGSAPIVACFVGAAALLVAFVAIERRVRAPMLDLDLFRDSTFVGANACGLVAMCSLFGFIFFMSLYLQIIRGYSPIHAGALFLISTVAIIFASPLSGKLADRVGARLPVSAGLGVFGLSLVAMSLVIETDVQMWKLYVGFFVGGLGFGLVLPAATTAIMGSVSEDRSGIASGFMQAMRQLGGALGVATAGALVAAQTAKLVPREPGYADAFVAGLENVLLFTGLVAVAGAGIAWLIRRGPATHGAAVVPGL